MGSWQNLRLQEASDPEGIYADRFGGYLFEMMTVQISRAAAAIVIALMRTEECTKTEGHWDFTEPARPEPVAIKS